jgi:hypothetical protein
VQLLQRRGDDLRDLTLGLRTRGAHGHPAEGVVVQQSRSHLRAADVVDAKEQHLRHGDLHQPFGPAEVDQPLAGEPGGQRRQVDSDRRVLGEQVVGLAHEQLDGFAAENSVEAVGKLVGDAVQLQPDRAYRQAVRGVRHGALLERTSLDRSLPMQLKTLGSTLVNPAEVRSTTPRPPS